MPTTFGQDHDAYQEEGADGQSADIKGLDAWSAKRSMKSKGIRKPAKLSGPLNRKVKTLSKTNLDLLNRFSQSGPMHGDSRAVSPGHPGPANL